MKLLTILIPFIFFISCQNQGNTSDAKPVKSLEKYLDGWIKYDFSSDIKKRYDSSKNNDQAAILYSNIGNYFSALEVFDQSNEAETQQFLFFDSINFKAVDAIDYIVHEANKNQIIIINEAHHVPYHRFFTMLLLEKLHDKGFNYFGAETLNSWDSTLNERKYPTFFTGYYTLEPQYGNLIRQALNTGFKIFAYEANELNTITNGMQREIVQAKNIAQILKNDPHAKIIIHCGYGHLIEGNLEGWGKAMAGRVKEYTGIDPLTIDQVELTEHFDKKYENPFYGKFNYKNFVVLKNNDKTLPVCFRTDGQESDVFVYHPRTHLKYNRPHWLFNFYTSKFITNEITIPFPVLVKAYISGEHEKDAIPVDVVEIRSKTDSIALALFPNRSYKIVIENKQKQKQTIEFKL